MQYTYRVNDPLPSRQLTKLLELMTVTGVMAKNYPVAEVMFQGRRRNPRVKVDRRYQVLGGVNRRRLIGVEINGEPPEEGAPFVFPPDGQGAVFIDTEDKPYDVVVVACLALAKHLFPKSIDIYSEGGPTHWRQGVALANWAVQISVPKELRHLPPTVVANPIV